MPELPEVETIRSDLEKEILGAKILDIWTDTPKMLQPSVEAVRGTVVGSKIGAIKRRAKLLIFSMRPGESERSEGSPNQVPNPRNHSVRGRQVRNDGDGVYLLIHLKLSGRLLLREATDPPDDWQHIVLTLEMPDGEKKELRFCDLRKFGYLKLVDWERFQEIYSEYGPEPLDDLTLGKFQAILSKSKIAIKKLLMDQKRISGIGNIYANEALWLAKVHPERAANGLSLEESKNLFAAIENVLGEGLRYRGTTAKDDFYLDAHGKKGNYQSQLRIYREAGKPCPRCGTLIKRIKVGGRGTFFCPTCQPR